MKDNKEVVFIAVRTSGIALEYASKRLKNNRTIVLKALETKPEAVKHASSKLRDDYEIALTTLKKNPDCLMLFSHKIKNLLHKKEDPIFTLESLINNKTLEKDIPKQKSVKKIKI